MSEINGPEHDFEPVLGLPAQLPPGETILWQGQPERRAVLRHVLHARWVAAYFGIAALWVVMLGINDGRPLADFVMSLGWVFGGAALMFALAYAFAYAVCRTSLYTITNKRVVMRVGIAISASFNLPFKQIDGADLRKGSRGTGDIALSLKPGHGLSSAVFWPHHKGMIWSPLSPQMICVPDVDKAAQTLTDALTLYSANEGLVDAQKALNKPKAVDLSGRQVLKPAKGQSGLIMTPAE